LLTNYHFWNNPKYWYTL